MAKKTNGESKIAPPDNYEPYTGSVYTPNALLMDEIAAVLHGGEPTADVTAWLNEWDKINPEPVMNPTEETPLPEPK